MLTLVNKGKTFRTWLQTKFGTFAVPVSATGEAALETRPTGKTSGGNVTPWGDNLRCFQLRWKGLDFVGLNYELCLSVVTWKSCVFSNLNDLRIEITFIFSSLPLGNNILFDYQGEIN